MSRALHCVFDTSVLVRLFVPDGPLPGGVEECLDAAWRGSCVLHAPELALAEVGGVLRKKEAAGHLSSVEVDEVLDAVLSLPIRYAGHADLLAPAVALSRATGATACDCLFIALARRLDGDLYTADQHMAVAALVK